MIEQKTEYKLTGVATKQDIYELKQDLSEFKMASKQDIYELKQDLSELKQDINEDMSALKIVLLKEMSANNRWLIGIIFALAVMIIGLYFKH